uniref:polynucleotide adenylyltransferase n=1 Tax=Bubo bubo TaxID=30461 RepID=A0A8C0EQQ8_BUBBB
MKPSGVLKDGEELNHRLVVLGNLNHLVNEWISELGESKNLPPSAVAVANVGGKILTFGSYWLGVEFSLSGADRDAVSVAPRHVERSDSFHNKKYFLTESSAPLQAVEDGYVPVVKFECDGVEIDLVFARPSVQTVSDNLGLRGDWHLRSLDELLYFNFFLRVADEMLHLVPNEKNFQLTLCPIKLWAKRHGIYSNLLGFLGGVSWMMLVARTCPLYSSALASALHTFFLVPILFSLSNCSP